ncbi:MAG: hypothetical protein M3203_17445 [Actinomycetota bacterium]|nr:hypothetical protein [Actinomycetota bacterium]
MRRLLVAIMGVGLAVLGSAGSASAQTGTNQRFIVIVSGSDGNETSRVIAIGPIRGVGTFEETEDEDVVRFVFRDGSSVTLYAPSEEEDEQFNERSCSGSFTFSGPWEIIDATGAYEGAEGSGQFEGRGIFVGERARGGGCSEDEDSGFFFLRVNVSGNVTVPGQAAA